LESQPQPRDTLSRRLISRSGCLSQALNSLLLLEVVIRDT
jgi:hypothetical protein